MAVDREGLVGSGDPDRDVGGDRLLRRRGHQPGRCQRGFHLRQLVQRPDRVLLPEQPVGHLGADRAPVRIPLYRRASGFGFPGVRVDGNDVLAVHAVTTAALERARSGNGPSFIEAYTYRMGAHTTSDDPTKYRLADELEHWRLKDPIERVRAYLSRTGRHHGGFFAEVDAEADYASELRARCLALPEPHMLDMFDQVYAEQTPFLAAQKAGYADYLESFEGADMVDGPGADSDSPAGAVAATAPGSDDGSRPEHAGPELAEDSTHSPRTAESTDARSLPWRRRSTRGCDERWKPIPRSSSPVKTSESRRRLPGAEGLQKDFGDHRVIDSPLAESGIVGTAVGMERGYRPVCEIQFDGFVSAFDQIVSQVARLRFRSGGRPAPMVIRVPFGGGIGAVEHHSESPEAYFAHTVGLKVVACSNPADACWMIQQAVASDDPIIFFERSGAHEKAEVDEAAPPLPLHAARVARTGSDVTLVAYGPMVRTWPRSRLRPPRRKAATWK